MDIHDRGLRDDRRRAAASTSEPRQRAADVSATLNDADTDPTSVLGGFIGLAYFNDTVRLIYISEALQERGYVILW